MRLIYDLVWSLETAEIFIIQLASLILRFETLMQPFDQRSKNSQYISRIEQSSGEQHLVMEMVAQKYLKHKDLNIFLYYILRKHNLPNS